MIRTFIIYKIIDKWIDSLFNSFKLNFSRVSIDEFEPGRRFEYLSYVELINYNGVMIEISHIFSSGEITGRDGEVVHFYYDDYEIIYEFSNEEDADKFVNIIGGKVEQAGNCLIVDVDHDSHTFCNVHDIYDVGWR